MVEKLEQKYCGNANWTNEGLQPVLGHDNDNRECDIVFVHGLAGHAWGTWHPEGKDGKCSEFWPAWLWKDLKDDGIDVAVWTFGYKAPRLNWNGVPQSLTVLANELLEFLKDKSIAKRPLIFITHSMGGLLIKKLLETARNIGNETTNDPHHVFCQKLIKTTKGIVFLATPHRGSSLANPIKWCIILPVGINVKELQPNQGVLEALNKDFREFIFNEFGIKVKVYYELKKLFNIILVVDKISADPELKSVTPIGIGEDHNSIAKLKSKTAEVYSGTKSFIKSLLSEGLEEQSIDINKLVQEVREKVKPYIKEHCATMQVLDMTQPIGLSNIYTDVNILEKITGRTRREIAEIIQNCNLEDFDRFGLSKVTEKRVLGLQAVQQHRKLMVLGKPGAGKSTFLKYLAMQCTERQFQKERFPIFITLKDFAEAPEKPDILKYITKLLSDSDLTDANVKAQQLLKQGKVLILLDGLDEVREEDASRVLKQVQEFSYQFSANQFIITCRIAAKEYTFQGFTEVEVADFNSDQIASFAQNWFQFKKDPVKGERFIEKLKQNKPIEELATNPLLLTLLCLIFGEAGDFPTNRSELYTEGVDVLLKKWDVRRNIERDKIYKDLSLQRKEDLLSHIALITFEQKDYFFKKKTVEGYIADFIRNLRNTSTTESALELDSEAILKSIEVQHGLLIARATGIYSFSHLIFHEYFMARGIKERFAWARLAEHVTQKRWREVFLLTTGMVQNADDLLKSMKHRIDELLVSDEKLQQFLTWVNEKSKSIELLYKPAAVRAFYLEFAHKFFLAIDKGEEIFSNFSIWYFSLASSIDKHLEYIFSCPYEEDHLFELYNDLADLKNAIEIECVHNSDYDYFDTTCDINDDEDMKKLQAEINKVYQRVKDPNRKIAQDIEFDLTIADDLYNS
ncbi:MAG: NACHT domain-containing protein, partial [Rhizonema sp. PD37]|nr:NACHT domain-containing protein [Rhizonema sp. PD37]